MSASPPQKNLVTCAGGRQGVTIAMATRLNYICSKRCGCFGTSGRHCCVGGEGGWLGLGLIEPAERLVTTQTRRPQKDRKTVTVLPNAPLMAIFADHLDVPSRTLCLMLFMCWTWIILGMLKILRISSKISGLFLSRIFILSFMAMMMCCVRSSAPVLELFSAAPEDDKEAVK